MEDQLTLTHYLEPQDSIDDFILKDILAMVQNTQVLTLVDFYAHEKLGRDKAGEHFLSKILLVATALCKANAHLRNYKRIEDIFTKELTKESFKGKTNIDMLFNKTDIFVEIEGFLSYFKTSLDLLAQSLSPVYGLNHTTWAHKKDPVTKERMSGKAIANSLLGTGKKQIQHTEPLGKLVEANIPLISRIVKLRDAASHYGKIKDIQGYRYSVSHDEIVPPLVKIDDKTVAYVSDYLTEGMGYLNDFVQEFLVTLLSNLIPDMVIRKSKSGEWGWYSPSGFKSQK